MPWLDRQQRVGRTKRRSLAASAEAPGPGSPSSQVPNGLRESAAFVIIVGTDQMEPSSSYRPKISRESRWLLIAGTAAVTLLWVLARIRFEDRPVTPNPVAPVLSQLNSGAGYDALASDIADLQVRLLSSLALVDTARAASVMEVTPHRAAAFRWRDELAMVLLPAQHTLQAAGDLDIRAVDPATRLAVVRLAGQTAAPAPTVWMPRRPQQPRYLASTTATPLGVSLRPAFVAALVPSDGAAWPGTIWTVPPGSGLDPGSFVFTTTGELVGLVITSRNGLAVVPGATLMAEAERLVSAPPGPPGTIGVEVQALTPPLARVTGARTGVLVAWVRPDGSAAKALAAGDVIEAVDGRDVRDVDQWDARVSRLGAGDSLALRVRRRGDVREATVQATAVTADAASAALGLSLRRRAGIGAEVTRIQPASVAARAGLSVGDIITLFGGVVSPSPNQVARSFAALRPGDRLMVAATRGESHYVTVLGR